MKFEAHFAIGSLHVILAVAYSDSRNPPDDAPAHARTFASIQDVIGTVARLERIYDSLKGQVQTLGIVDSELERRIQSLETANGRHNHHE